MSAVKCITATCGNCRYSYVHLPLISIYILCCIKQFHTIIVHGARHLPITTQLFRSNACRHASGVLRGYCTSLFRMLTLEVEPNRGIEEIFGTHFVLYLLFRPMILSRWNNYCGMPARLSWQVCHCEIVFQTIAVKLCEYSSVMKTDKKVHSTPTKN